MKILAKYIAGSYSYGLNTPESDKDERGVVLSTDINNIIGLGRFDHLTKQTKTEDYFYYELRHFLNNLRKSTTGALEILFNDNWIELDSDFENVIIRNREKLIDTEKFYKCLMGYLFGEKKLITGERTGLLGSKRKIALEKYQYSPKNFINALRLSYVGCYFFKTGVYPVDISKFDPNFAQTLMAIKKNPEIYNKDDTVLMVNLSEAKLKESFDNRDKTKDYKFDVDFANECVLKFYYPILAQKV